MAYFNFLGGDRTPSVLSDPGMHRPTCERVKFTSNLQTRPSEGPTDRLVIRSLACRLEKLSWTAPIRCRVSVLLERRRRVKEQIINPFGLTLDGHISFLISTVSYIHHRRCRYATRRVGLLSAVSLLLRLLLLPLPRHVADVSATRRCKSTYNISLSSIYFHDTQSGRFDTDANNCNERVFSLYRNLLWLLSASVDQSYSRATL